jgi:ACT domain-containing protein
MSKEESKKLLEQIEEEGLQLWKMLKNELKGKYDVVYFSNTKNTIISE